MRKLTLLLIVAALIPNTYTWADTPTQPTKNIKPAKAKKCLFPKSRKRAPAWICNPQEESLTVTALGSFAKSKAGHEFMEQMATADARARLADKLNGSVQKKIAESEASSNKNISNPDNALITKITNETLEGTKIIKSVYAPNGRLYVLLGLDEAGTQKLYEAVATNYLAQKHK